MIKEGLQLKSVRDSVEWSQQHSQKPDQSLSLFPQWPEKKLAASFTLYKRVRLLFAALDCYHHSGTPHLQCSCGMLAVAVARVEAEDG